MFSLWVVSGIVVLYLLVLFAIAFFADRKKQQHQQHPYIYSLALGVHCTSWAFFGTTTQAAQYGWAFIPTYLGMIIAFVFGFELIRRIAQYCQTHQISSLADFVGARYNSQFSIGALVTLVCFIGVIPYIALQLDAITLSFNLIASDNVANTSTVGIYVAGLMALFAILFGTRTLSLTEKHPGLMTTIAFESIIKLVGILIVGFYTCYILFDGPLDIFVQAAQNAEARQTLTSESATWVYVCHTLLGICAAFCLPRQFHINFVENNGEDELRTARWLFPTYLVLMSLFILPIALAGDIVLDSATYSTDSYILAIPIEQEQAFVAITAFIGGLGAATSMVIVATLALGIMIANNLVTPLWLRLALNKQQNRPLRTQQVLTIRRLTVIIVLAVAYWYHVNISQTAPLVQSGTVAMALLAQVTPAILMPFFWARSNALAAWLGIITGSVCWAVLILWPSITASYYFDPVPSDAELASAFIMSLCANVLVHVIITWLSKPRETANQNSESQPHLMIYMRDLDALLRRILPAHEVQDLLATTAESPKAIASAPMLSHCERRLASQVGIAGARILLSTIAHGRGSNMHELVDLAERASQTLQFNHEVLKSSVQHIQQGISVLDSNLTMLAWNERYLQLFDYPEGFINVGMPIEEVLRANAKRGLFGQQADIEQEIAKRIDHMRTGREYKYVRRQSDKRTIEINGRPLPGGGYVTTYADISEYIQIQEQLSAAKAQLEERVYERTQQLEIAKLEADAANVSKTKFLAAAGHDLMQPLNAAVLYSAMLNQLTASSNTSQQMQDISEGIQQSLNSAESLLNSLLDITKLDSGVLQTHITRFPINDLFASLAKEFQVIAAQKSVSLRFVVSHYVVESDKKLLRRILQNLISNAIRYTRTDVPAKVIIGAKRRPGQQLQLIVADNGIGIADEQKAAIFDEFHRVHPEHQAAGLGLGLTIVERMSSLLGHKVSLRSKRHQGSLFAVSVPYSVSKTDAPQKGQLLPAQQDSASEQFLADSHVVLIENEHQIQTAVTALLRQWGATVTVADSQQQLLSNVPTAPDLVIVDYHLNGGETGIDAVTQGFSQWGKKVPGILTTANRDDSVKDEALTIGLDFLPKPVKPVALKRALRRCLTTT
ncbi:PAS domain-containing hybrid sensor histidine kinase/response regulator [Alteromonas sp. ASW11-36]|uniref:histidine kinase n=1 Tax=Alteromonas arenosi TaxID=3055817 RepID=A0ABT7SUJ3_9ALTE|nr:PAS domain-containing hybrid sensor histidine kinase/response regulator [Alteromonas sp. ASW11-36]MDM7859846.1 PAS domain-containing hybrid sensor histidine kinase/response regulator [Alteromonas sp. ASW11-36]